MRILVAAMLALTALAGCADVDPPADDTPDGPTTEETGYRPHVIVGVPDSGINPYHELYFRANLSMHPSAYIEDFPTDIPALNLTVDPTLDLSWEERFEADQDLWQEIGPGDVFWIPQTVFVAVVCESGFDSDAEICILDDSNMHGTGTTSSIITENPDALIAFKEGGSSVEPIIEAGIPVDIFSVSWGYIAPIPVAVEGVLSNSYSPIYVLAAGNDPRSILLDSWPGDTRAIAVGGAYSQDNTQESLAGNQADVVSYFCRPTAQTQSLDEMRESYCGTSFATPTVAGALSKVVLAIREQSGYNGTIQDGMVDPVAGVSIADLRAALNRTASYDPEAQYENTGFPAAVPLNPAAPWVQWGWGFYDGLVANATVAHFLSEPAPEKPMEAQLYMEAVYEARQTVHG